jgi:hypothetical protein
MKKLRLNHDYGQEDGLLWYRIKITGSDKIQIVKLYIKLDECNNWLKVGWAPDELIDLPRGPSWSVRTVNIFLITQKGLPK